MVDNLNTIIKTHIKDQISVSNYFNKHLISQVRKDYSYYIDNEANFAFYSRNANNIKFGISAYNSKFNRPNTGLCVLASESLIKYSVCTNWIKSCRQKYFYRFKLKSRKIFFKQTRNMEKVAFLSECYYASSLFKVRGYSNIYFKKSLFKPRLFRAPILKQINEITSIKE